MSNDERAIPVSLVLHTVYCERRAWLEINGEKTDTSQMQSGHSAHKSVDNPKSSRNSRLVAVPISSSRFGIAGRVDELRIDDSGATFIVDYKSTPVRKRAQITPGQRVQLALQRVCLEEEGRAISGQGVYFIDHNKLVEIELTDADVTEAISFVNRTREITEAVESPPPLVNDEQCSRCSHFAVCLPDEHLQKATSRRIFVANPDTQVLHLSTPGSRASIKKGRLIVTADHEEVGSVPLERVQAVIVHGNIDLSGALLRELFWIDIPVVWCSSTGRVYGYSRPTDGPNGLARVRQHTLSEQGDLGIASQIVAAKIHNQATLLRRSNVSKDVISSLREASKEVLQATDISSVFGIEGRAAKLYFEYFPNLISPERIHELGWNWKGRIGRGARDPVNVLLNLAYGLLRTECVRAILACGLDTHAGFLHSSNRNKPALALDLMEEFRAPICDSIVVSMINRREIGSSDFSWVGGAARLSPNGRKRVISAFERRIQTSIKHPIFEYDATWRRTIEIQARMILGVIDKSVPTYQGVRIR